MNWLIGDVQKGPYGKFLKREIFEIDRLIINKNFNFAFSFDPLNLSKDDETLMQQI